LEGFDFDAADLVCGRHGERALLVALDLADSREHVALDLGELVVGELTELEAPLRLAELFAEGGIVGRSRFGSRDDLIQHEPQTADQQRIENEHRGSTGGKGWKGRKGW